MKRENKLILTALMIAAFIGAGLYFGLREQAGTSPATTNPTCAHIPPLRNNSTKKVIEVVDGDTFIIEGNYSVRLIGVDADERGGYCFEEAKERIEQLVLNKKVKLEKGEEDLDKYCRYLRYAFADGTDTGLTLIKEGWAEAHFYSNTSKYRSEYIEAEEIAREGETGCEWGEQKLKNETAKSEKDNLKVSWKTLTKEKTGLEIVPVCDADDYVGKEVIIEGVAVDTYRSRTNTVFLNFGSTYPNHCFVAVIFNSDQHRFPDSPEDLYKNETLRIRGRVKMYEGKPEIILERREQIEIGK